MSIDIRKYEEESKIRHIEDIVKNKLNVMRISFSQKFLNPEADKLITVETIKEIHKDYQDLYPNMEVLKRIILGYTYTTVGNIPTKAQIRNTNAKLTEQQVKEIRNSYVKGKTSYRELGEKFGLSETAVMNIIKRKTYKNVD